MMTDCLPIHIESDDGVEESNEIMAKRQKIDHGGTSSSISYQKFKVASASSPFEMIIKKCDNLHGETASSTINVASASSLCDFCANFADRFGFLHDGLLTTLSAEHIHRLRKQNTEKMLLQRKLHLVLDLDHTLVSYTTLSSLTPEEAEYIKTRADSQDVFTVRLPPKMEPVVIKFRPFLRTFLKEASELFEIYAYASAPQSLVWKIVELLDPRNEYFGRRVISPEYFRSTHGEKSLDPVLGQKSAVFGVDDSLLGWKKNSRNCMMYLNSYCFFKKGGKKRKRKTLCELESDERTASLAKFLRRLRRIHRRFFNDEVMCDNLFERDVRMLLKIELDRRYSNRLTLWRNALANCMWNKVVESPSYQQMMMAKQSSRVICVKERVDDPSSMEDVEDQSSGATFVEEQADDPSSSEDAEAALVGKSPARWCHLSWIDISVRLWQKRNVDKYPVMTEDSEFTCSSCGCSSYMNIPKPLCRSFDLES